MCLDLMLPMAIGADRRIEVPLPLGRRVHTAIIFRGYLLVTFGAGAWLVLLVNASSRHHRAVHFVRSVTIDAVRRRGLSLVQRRAVHTLINRQNKLRAAQRLPGDGGFFHMAGLAKIRLRKLELDRSASLAVFACNGFLVTGQADRRIRRTIRQRLTVRRIEKLFALHFMALAASVGLAFRGKGKLR